uniref:G_PROTEIN_RECEP_F1_2 domain-containing protein n=1 Tax=Panagrellus redivivus TaxID=6233 RepID=A0A7E4ZT24_PANRE
MGGFKKVLLLTCVSEMTFSAVNFVFLVTLAVQDGTYFIIVDGVLGHFSPFWTRIAFAFFVTMVYVSVYNTAVVFFYRYLIVCRSKTLNAWLFLFCVAVGWVLVILYTATILSNCTVDPSKNPKMDKMLTAIGFPSNGSSFHDFEKVSRFSLISATTFTTLVYGAVIIMSFAVQKRFKRLKSLLSKEEQRFHKEITTVLWIEALTPFITIVLPIYYDISAFVLPERPFDWFAEFDWILTIMGPCFTAVLKIISIKAFRETIISMIRQMCYKGRNDVDLFTRHKVISSMPNLKL